MTDKHIIIDGVDVSRCIYFNKWTDYTCQLEGKGNAHTLCKSLDCYYKQLAHKTQECEILQQLENEEKEIIAELKAEKAKLEAQIGKDTQYYVKEECNLRNIIRNKEKRNIELYKENNQLKALKEQAEQKLEQIKQVCKDYCKIMCLCETKETCESCINTEILQIIDEVE